MCILFVVLDLRVRPGHGVLCRSDDTSPAKHRKHRLSRNSIVLVLPIPYPFYVYYLARSMLDSTAQTPFILLSVSKRHGLALGDYADFIQKVVVEKKTDA